MGIYGIACTIAGRQVLGQEGSAAQTCVAPGFGGKAVSLARIDLQLIRNPFALEHLLQMVSLFDRYRRVSVAMQDQNGTEAAHEKLHFLGQAAEKFDHGADAGIDGRGGAGEIGAQGKAEQADAFGIDRRLSGDKTDRVPKGLHPKRKMAKNGGFVGGSLGGRPVKVVQNVDRETLLRQ